jgi:predicted Zn finger-like uncharacterized protein
MKIVCDACQAKYSISDDKVQGKVFKIRCKKCSNIIVVRGGAQAAEAPAPAAADAKDTRVYDYGYEGGGGGGDEAVWHVVINQDQVGPMTAAEVQQRFSAGEIDAETYAWREGFADWLPLTQVDAFASFLASTSTMSAAGGGGSGAAAVSSMFGNDESGTVRSDPGDLFAAASAGSSSRGKDDDGDLFGSKPAKASHTSTQAAAEAKLRGERNENSVLFSLNNLAQLASDKPAPNAGVSSMPSGHATGAAGGEGSGLIDIRSMANAYLGGSGAAAKTATASSGIGSIDDLPVFGGGGFSEPAVIVPTASRGQNNKMMYALIGSVAFLAVAAVIMIIVLLKGGDDKKVVVAQGDPKDGSAEAKGNDDSKGSDTKSETPTTNTGSAETPTTNGSAADPAKSEEPAKTAEPAKTEEPVKTEPKKTEPKRTEPKKTTQAVAKVEPKKTEPKKTEPASSGGGGCDEVSCVLNNYEGACCAKFKKKSSGGGTAPKASGGGDLPDALDRAMISDGVNKVKARVQSCGDKSSAKGQVKVSVKVNPGGDVASVSVKNTPDAGLGNCVAAAMQKARFAKTQNGGSFGYPFMF